MIEYHRHGIKEKTKAIISNRHAYCLIIFMLYFMQGVVVIILLFVHPLYNDLEQNNLFICVSTHNSLSVLRLVIKNVEMLPLFDLSSSEVN